MVKKPSSPKHISETKIRFQKILLSRPSGLQYSAKTKTIAKAEIMILIRLARSSESENPVEIRDANSGFFSKPTIPKAININPNKKP